MDREEILRRSKENMCIEEYKQVKNSGQELGTTVFIILASLIAVSGTVMGKPSYAVQTLFWGYFGSIAYVKYKAYQTKTILISLIACIIASSGFLLLYMMKLFNINF